MKKLLKRFISIVVSLAVCFSCGTFAMATNVDKKSNAIESQGKISTYSTTVGSLIFDLNNFGNTSKTALKNKGTQRIVFRQQPTQMSYYILAADGSSGTVRVVLNNYQVTLTVGKAGTINLKSIGLPINSSVEVSYEGASTSLVSISLVFSK